MGVTVVGIVSGVVGFVIVAQSDAYNGLGSGLMQLGISLAVIPLGSVLIRLRLARRTGRPR